ncbi:hypothetical protein BCON_0361g00010 [Botryotinia convoluta]|uniref:Uncharacterized protein n=1 Tax=Botryotinia convoluta TaxID=54673 RepID=A0A4Z1HC35_9HELO|nr:hypothetical protein BCON_0361g00010 [Botryotinia convoluta]
MASKRSEILLLSLAFRDFLDDTYSSLIDSLNKSTKLERAKSSSDAIQYLEAHNPKAILVTDEGLTETTNGAVLEKVQSYIKNGGLVIFGLHFPNFTRMDIFDKFFDKDFGLPWQHGDYHRAIFRFNSSCTLPAGTVKDSIPLEYSMKVLHVQNAKQHEKIFLPVPGGTTQSLVFPSSHVDEEQAAVVGAKIGDGFLVYCGDINGEQGSDKVILALCGL